MFLLGCETNSTKPMLVLDYICHRSENDQSAPKPGTGRIRLAAIYPSPAAVLHLLLSTIQNHDHPMLSVIRCYHLGNKIIVDLINSKSFK